VSRFQFLNESLDWTSLKSKFVAASPFQHVVIDDFFNEELARTLEQEFPAYDDPVWYGYDNKIENKKILNHWDKFKPTTYRTLRFLNSPEFVDKLGLLTGLEELESDMGLNGGGWHAHSRGGKLNVHLDYSVHPKLGMERRLNLIVYLTEQWRTEWGGALEFWSHNESNNRPKDCAAAIECKFNRAVIFDTTQNSWHGLPEALTCPEKEMRRSLAAYYLTPARQSAPDRGKALFAPYKEQENDPEVLELIKKRSNVNLAAGVYEPKK
jgi:Rps23 Pro-64 3,4-dihydroxylase Tpa1-like proline 4-hydroxylase